MAPPRGDSNNTLAFFFLLFEALPVCRWFALCSRPLHANATRVHRPVLAFGAFVAGFRPVPRASDPRSRPVGAERSSLACTPRRALVRVRFLRVSSRKRPPEWRASRRRPSAGREVVVRGAEGGVSTGLAWRSHNSTGCHTLRCCRSRTHGSKHAAAAAAAPAHAASETLGSSFLPPDRPTGFLADRFVSALFAVVFA